ncbi:ankyrin repeat domain-containing protein [Endozoicomonas sp. SCSIO W0465]|uniref:ankyrin repeat domain-containing protein n=1 Tax=Endozoicomonas sp. SCSIO W0465 TaxID=2918516 RepID=UPI002074C8FE|nr:ankyrin repeat domain-containing protein [Endozoicomonas sp. SCSIO W0465]USE38501.1 ankyrin repeat domain-containing protein [Endozoicomonas sp. SCSIO W0465]
MNIPPYTAHQTGLAGAGFTVSTDDGSPVRPVTPPVISGSIEGMDPVAGQSILTRNVQRATVAALPVSDTSIHPDRSNPLNEPPILAACRYNRIAWLQELLAGDPALAYRVAASGLSGKNWVYPLYVAAYKGHIDCLQALIAAGADLNAANKNGDTPLYIAAQNRHIDCLQALIAAGADLNAATRYGFTPLYIAAAREGHIDCLQALIDAGADLNAATKNGCTPLYMAAQEGLIDCLQVLIDAGADLNAATSNGWTPLHTAADQGLIDCLQALIVAGADLNLAPVDGFTALYAAARNGHVECLKLLIASKAMKTTLLAAAQGGQTNVLAEILANLSILEEPDKSEVILLVLNMADPDGRTQLFWAAQFGHIKVVDQFLDALNGLPEEKKPGSIRAVLGAADRFGRTPLYMAAAFGHDKIVTRLLAALTKTQTPDTIAALVNAADLFRKTPVVQARSGGHSGITSLLIRASSGAVYSEGEIRDAHTAVELFNDTLLRLNTVSESARLTAVMAVLYHAREDVLLTLDVADLERYDTLVVELLAALKRCPEAPGDASRNHAILQLMDCLCAAGETGFSYSYVANQGQEQVAELLQAFPILSAARNGQTDIVDRIVKILATWPESKRCQAVTTAMTLSGNDGGTALHVAAGSGQSKVVEQILNKLASFPEAEQVAVFGALVGAVDTRNRSPLKVAMDSGYGEIVNQLTQAIPLLSAVAGGHNKSVEQFMRALQALPEGAIRCSAITAVLKRARPEGATPLYIAASLGNIEVIKLLLGAVDTLLTDGKRREAREVLYSACRVEEEGGAIGKTPLMIAAEKLHDEAVMLLLEAIRKLFSI